MKVRDAGYKSWDCHTPYPLHGLDEAMGLAPTKIGVISFICGLMGLIGGALLIQYANNWDYPIIIGGKPPGSFPSMVPVCFELTVLFSAFGAVFGMFGLNRLPQLYHSLFNSSRFGRFSDDRFFISIEARDPKYDAERTRKLLESTGATAVEEVED